MSTSIEQIKEILEGVFPDNWEITFVEEDSNYCRPLYQIVIRFPEILITNSSGYEHTIRDLYVMFRMNSEFRLRHNDGGKKLMGRRGTVTDVEYVKGYKHSHLPSTRGTTESFAGWQNFCLGTAPLLVDFENLMYGFEPYLFEAFLYGIDGYVRWESIEGKPHFHMKKLVIEGTLPYVDESDKKEYYKRYIRKNDTFPLTFDRLGKRPLFRVKRQDDVLEKQITPLLREAHLVIKGGNGSYGGIPTPPDTSTADLDRVLFRFREQDVKLKIIKTKYETKTERVAHPEVTKYIAAKLEDGINEYYLCQA